MADNKLLQQMLEHLVNDDQAKAEELFHEYVVTASREIYESLIDSEIAEEEKDDEEMDEAAKDDDAALAFAIRARDMATFFSSSKSIQENCNSSGRIFSK